MCKRESHWRWLSGCKEVSAVPASFSSCLGLWHRREITGCTVETFSTKLNMKLRMCHSKFLRQKLPFLGTQRYTLLWSTASLGFHTREKGGWQIIPFFFSGMKPGESGPQLVCWFLWIHPSCCWECISECHYHLPRNSLDQNNYIIFLIFCMTNQSHRVGSKKLVYLEYCISELITLLTLDFVIIYSLILLKMQINLSDQQKKNNKYIWKSLKQPSLTFAIECYTNSCLLGREREVSQDKVTRETSSKKGRFTYCKLGYLSGWSDQKNNYQSPNS